MRSALRKLPTWSWKFERPLPVHTQILFFHRVSHILSKGYPLLEALSMTSWDKTLKPISDELNHSLTKGETIDEGFRNAKFSKVVTNYLYFARSQHDLASSFRQCKDILQLRREYTRKVIQATRYPVLLLLFMLVAFSIIQHTVLPNFLVLFEEQSTDTLWLLKGISLFIRTLGVLALLSVLASILLRLITPKLSIDNRIRLFKKIPLFYKGYSFVLSFLFSHHLQTLLQTKLTLKESLEFMRQHQRYDILAHYSEQILNELAFGRTLSQAIHPCEMLRSELTDLFHQTNDVDALNDELELLSEFYMDHMKTTLLKWVQWIQPAFFLLIAFLVITIYASIMLPLYEWMNQL
ncbi:type II secretion system F family protein [Halobacillus locisalis]|uniref:Type II secretion system F family protein n=1 Tax=Halobacillus locisalis TaxID=220753 RepID=A0A838CN45_9BACI|nr:type II secretion system F family protein [Halobacillus locisalis]MBA2173612.1 type II secretion system F family protein [Halobacillus locisalis]